MNHKIDRDTYIIPPNFIESGTFFGGMFKARNVIEAGILAFAIGVPVFSLLPLGLTARIIALCLTALPAALVALIGISGESLSSFLLIFIKYLRQSMAASILKRRHTSPIRLPGGHGAPAERVSQRSLMKFVATKSAKNSVL